MLLQMTVFTIPRFYYTAIIFFVIIKYCHCYKSAWRPVFHRRDGHQYDQPPPEQYLPEPEYHHHEQPLSDHENIPHNHRIPQEVMVDTINELGLKLLAIHNENNENNIAISPYGAVSVLVALGEGLAGDAVEEIQHAAQLPHDVSVIRVGLRDIHRHLKSYFIPKEGFLAGLTLNHENVTLNKKYEDILRFYGYDTDSFNNALYPDPYTTQKPSDTITTLTPESITFNKKEGSEELTTIIPTTLQTETTTTNAETMMTEPTTTEILTEATTVLQTESITLVTSQAATSASSVGTTITTRETTTLPTSTESSRTITTEKVLTTLPVSTESPTTITTLPASTESPTTITTLPSSTESPTTITTLSASTESPTTITTLSASTESPTTITTLPASTEPPKIITTEKVLSTETPDMTSTNRIETTTTEQTETVMKLNETEAIPEDVSEKSEEMSALNAVRTTTTTMKPPLTTTTAELSTVIPTSVKQDFDIFDTTLVETTTQPYGVVTNSGDIFLSNANENFTSVYNDDFLTTTVLAYTYETDMTTENLETSTSNFQNYYDYTDFGTTDNLPNSIVQTTEQFLESGENIVNNEISEGNFYQTDVNDTTTNFKKRQTRSVVDYIIARYYDHNSPPVYRERRPYLPEPQLSFLVNGKYKEYNVNFMTYDTVLPFNFIPHLNALALSFPLDSSKYYLLLLLPVDEEGIDQLICDLRLNASLKYIIQSLKYTHVRAVIPSFMLKGYVILTPTLQKLGIRRVFEPRQADFSPMTNEKGVYVTNIEQAVTVTIRNYVDPSTMNNHHRNLHQYDPVIFRADHPFLYFVIDTELHVTLMAGKIVNPLNSRIR